MIGSAPGIGGAEVLVGLVIPGIQFDGLEFHFRGLVELALKQQQRSERGVFGCGRVKLQRLVQVLARLLQVARVPVRDAQIEKRHGVVGSQFGPVATGRWIRRYSPGRIPRPRATSASANRPARDRWLSDTPRWHPLRGPASHTPRRAPHGPPRSADPVERFLHLLGCKLSLSLVRRDACQSDIRRSQRRIEPDGPIGGVFRHVEQLRIVRVAMLRKIRGSQPRLGKCVVWIGLQHLLKTLHRLGKVRFLIRTQQQILRFQKFVVARARQRESAIRAMQQPVQISRPDQVTCDQRQRPSGGGKNPRRLAVPYAA